MAAPGRALDASATDAFLWDLEADVTEASETIDGAPGSHALPEERLELCVSQAGCRTLRRRG